MEANFKSPALGEYGGNSGLDLRMCRFVPGKWKVTGVHGLALAAGTAQSLVPVYALRPRFDQAILAAS